MRKFWNQKNITFWIGITFTTKTGPCKQLSLTKPFNVFHNFVLMWTAFASSETSDVENFRWSWDSFFPILCRSVSKDIRGNQIKKEAIIWSGLVWKLERCPCDWDSILRSSKSFWWTLFFWKWQSTFKEVSYLLFWPFTCRRTNFVKKHPLCFDITNQEIHCYDRYNHSHEHRKWIFVQAYFFSQVAINVQNRRSWEIFDDADAWHFKEIVLFEGNFFKNWNQHWS